jgi:hypothetical protein
MVELLKLIDIFDTNFQFRTFNKSKFRTNIGGIISLTSVLLIIVFSIFFGWDFFFKKNPKILNQTIFPDKYPDPFLMTPENFVLPWRLSDDYSQTVNFTNLIYPRLQYFKYKLNESGQIMEHIEDLQYSKCNSLNAKVPEFVNEFKIEDWYCVDWDKHKNLTFGGYWDGDFVEYYSLVLHSCPNGEPFSPEGNCTSLDKLKDFLEGGNIVYVDFLYPEYYFVADDLNNPLRISYKNYFYGLSSSMIKKDRLFFKRVELYDDQGWIFNSETQTNQYGAYERDSEISFNNPDDYGKPGRSSIIYYMIYYNMKKFDHIQRSYMKFQDFSAVIGGFMKIVLVIAGLFSYLFNDKLRDEVIYNELFECKLDKFEKDNFTIKSQQGLQSQQGVNINSEIKPIGNDNNNNSYHLNNLKISNILNKNNSTSNILAINNKTSEDVQLQLQLNNMRKINLHIETNNNDVNKINEKEIYHRQNNLKNNINFISGKLRFMNSTIRQDNKHKHKKSISFGIWFHLKRNLFSCSCRKISPTDKKTDRVYSFLSNYIMERMDVIYYLKTLETIDRLKKIFLNVDQNLSLEFIKKPNLNNTDELEILEHELNKKTEINFWKLVEYYKQRIRSKEIDEIDEKLLNFIDPQIKILCLKD